MNGLAPGVWLSLLVGCIYGALAHLIWGRHWLHLPLFVLTGVVGCLLLWASGLQFLAALPAPGGLPLLEATAVAWLLLSGVAVLQRA
jgi:hypothetical protein